MRAAEEPVRAGTAEEPVASLSAAQEVGPAAAVEAVGALLAEDPVGALAARHHVSPEARAHAVVPAERVDLVGARAGDDHVGSGGAADLLGREVADDRRPPAVAGGAGRGVVVADRGAAAAVCDGRAAGQRRAVRGRPRRSRRSYPLGRDVDRLLGLARGEGELARAVGVVARRPRRAVIGGEVDLHLAAAGSRQPHAEARGLFLDGSARRHERALERRCILARRPHRSHGSRPPAGARDPQPARLRARAWLRLAEPG